jgi:hypothetical protein
MKKSWKTGMALAAIITLLFSFAACDDPNKDKDDTPSVPSGQLGDSALALSGTIVTEVGEGGSVEYQPYAAGGTLTATINGHSLTLETPAVAETSGAFSTLVPVPVATALLPLSQTAFDFATSNDETAKFGTLSLKLGGDTVNRTVATRSVSDSERQSTQRSVDYIYADKDVTLTVTEETTIDEGFSVTIHAASLALKKGWNALYSIANTRITQSSASADARISVANPSDLKWVLYDYDD